MKFEKWIYISVPLIIALSATGRHIYNLTGQTEIFAPFVAINKSVWEYLKTLFFSVLTFWTVAYFARYRLKVSREAAVTCAGMSALMSPLITVMLYYFYICAFGIFSKIIDVFIVIFSVMTSQFAAHYICINMYPSKRQSVRAFMVIIIMIAVVILFTYYPPKLPIFMDPETGTYGIKRIMD